MIWAARDILQLGYVGNSLQMMIDYFVDHQGAGPFYCLDIPIGAAAYTYRGACVEATFGNKVAFGYRGPLQFELIETDNPVFSHVLQGRSMACHHCLQMSDRFKQDETAYLEAGYKIMGTGEMPGARIHYIDTWARLGHYTELFDYDTAIRETGGAMFQLFAEMRRVSESWNGRDRARLMPGLPDAS